MQSVASMIIGSSKHLAITNIDSYHLCVVAKHLACELERDKIDVEIVCLTQHPDWHEKLRKHKNIRLEHVHANDELSFRNALNRVSCVLAVPPIEDEDEQNEYVQNLFKAIRHHRIENAMVLSVNGAESSEHAALRIFHLMERETKEHVKNWIILRRALVQHIFLLWAPFVRERQEFPLSIDEHAEFAPLNMCDYVEAVEVIVRDQYKHDSWLQSIHRNRSYSLTGPHKITPKMIVQELSEIVGREVVFKKVDRNELKRCLESLREHPEYPEMIDPDMCDVRVSGSKGGHKYAPSKAMIELILDELELVGKGEQGFVSDDLRKITGNEGRSMKEFFKEERDSFRGNN